MYSRSGLPYRSVDYRLTRPLQFAVEILSLMQHLPTVARSQNFIFTSSCNPKYIGRGHSVSLFDIALTLIFRLLCLLG